MLSYFISYALHFTNILRELEINQIYLLFDKGRQSGFKFALFRQEKKSSILHPSYEYGPAIITGILSSSYTSIERLDVCHNAPSSSITVSYLHYGLYLSNILTK